MLFWPFLLVCVQACMVQNVFSQCIGPYSTSPALTSNEALNIITAPFVASVTAPFTDSFLVQTAADACSAYGGAGLGETAVAGDLPSAGTTVLAGQVPVMGALEFGGLVSAAGTVSITATCASGCRGSNVI